MSSIRNIHFSFPCKENIHEMSACGSNKYCNVCDRTIIDFRNKTQEELEIIKENDENICGIFSEKQVAKGYERYFQLAAATVLTVGLSTSLYAQEEPDPFQFPPAKTNSAVCIDDTDENILVGVIIDDSPEYPGGFQAMKDFLQKNIIYPADSAEGKVYVSLVVDTLGNVTNVKIKKSLSPLADAEVSRVAKLLIFKPALLNGKPINSTISLPVTFSKGTE